MKHSINVFLTCYLLYCMLNTILNHEKDSWLLEFEYTCRLMINDQL